MMIENSQVCSVCVMDNQNPGVSFDDSGRCSACADAAGRLPFEWFPDRSGAERLRALAAAVKKDGRGKPYDAMIGLSGGVDSAYLAHVVVRELGLRVLAVHVDAGWNTEPAVRNIESLVRRLNLDLHTQVIEWHEMRDLQLAFLRASVLNQDIPQDHAFFSTLYRTAHRFDVRYFLSGVNFSSECVSPPEQGAPTAIDGVHVRGIHERFGNARLSSYPVMGLGEYLWRTRIRGSLTILKPLNFLPYDKVHAKLELIRTYDWRDYGGKHHESRFTRFYEQIYLPRKFGFDKRRQHLSSLIVSGQLSRNDALLELQKPIVDDSIARRDIKYVAKKLNVEVADLEQMISSPPRLHSSFPNQMAIHRFLTSLRARYRLLVSRNGRDAPASY